MSNIIFLFQLIIAIKPAFWHRNLVYLLSSYWQSTLWNASYGKSQDAQHGIYASGLSRA